MKTQIILDVIVIILCIGAILTGSGYPFLLGLIAGAAINDIVHLILSK